jgi:hypothetical protein
MILSQILKFPVAAVDSHQDPSEAKAVLDSIQQVITGTDVTVQLRDDPDEPVDLLASGRRQLKIVVSRKLENGTRIRLLEC